MRFESPDWQLDELLKIVASGELQLPDFQRDFIWDDERIRALLASVARGYPIGVVTTVETGGDGSRFKWRPLKGARDDASQRRPTMMLIDGQQRLTSLYQALMSSAPVTTVDSRGADILRWYYVNIEGALAQNGDWEKVIESIPADRKERADFGRKVLRDYSTTAAEWRAGVFPLRVIFDWKARDDWSDQYEALSEENRHKWRAFRNTVVNSIISYVVPIIKLAKDTTKEAVCTVFEKVNTGGVQLTVFELLTATYAGDEGYYGAHGRDFELSEDWKKIRGRLLSQDVLADLATPAGNPAFMQAVCLLATRQRRLDFVAQPGGSPQPAGISCKRADMLRLSLSEYLHWRDPLIEAFRWCGQFLNREFIFQARDVPYPSQLVPLAAIRAVLGRKADNRGIYAKIRQWFWCGVLGELYGGTTESKSARDLEQVVDWIVGLRDEPPETVTAAAFHENRLLTLSTRTSAAYKGLYALIMANGCHDWLRHQRLDFATFSDLKVDVHHIFPRAWCRQNGVRPRQCDSIINKTAISYDTNRAIGDRSPSDYLAFLERKGGVDPQTMDGLVASHAIDPRYLRSNDFKGFFTDRTHGLLTLVGSVMGKPPVQRKDAPKGDDPQDFPDDSNEIQEAAA